MLDLPSGTGKLVEIAIVLKKDRSSNEDSWCSRRMRQKNDISEERVQKQYFQFPDDILCEILYRLPIEALVRCRCVCKTWHRVTVDPFYIKMQMNMSNNQPVRFISQPLSTRFYRAERPNKDFVVLSTCMPHNRNRDTNRLCLLDIEEGKTRRMPLSEDTLEKYSLLFSYNGLICLARKNYANPLILCNPITKETLELPRMDYARQVHTQRAGLFYETARQNHVLVRVFEFGENGARCNKFFIITPGESSYRLLEHPPCVDDCEMGGESTVYWNHAFHWRISKKIGKSGNECILSFDTVHETFQIISFPGETSSLRDLNLELHVLDGHLTLIELAESKMRLWEVTGDRVGEFSLVDTGETYETHIVWGSLFRCSFLARLTRDLNLVKIRYGRSGSETIQSHFAFATKDMSSFTHLKLDGLPEDSVTLPYHPSLASVHSVGFRSTSINIFLTCHDNLASGSRRIT